MIETRGLVAAIEAAGEMVKTASVTIVRHTKAGSGPIWVLVRGEVGAAKAAIDAVAGAVAGAANKVGDVVSVHVTPRPMTRSGVCTTA